MHACCHEATPRTDGFCRRRSIPLRTGKLRTVGLRRRISLDTPCLGADGVAKAIYLDECARLHCICWLLKDATVAQDDLVLQGELTCAMKHV